MECRSLTQQEITYLEHQHCCADDWDTVKIMTGHTETNYRNVVFRGTVFIPRCSPEHSPSLPCIYNTCLHDCHIGNNVSIHDTGLCRNYHIEDYADIRNTKSIYADTESFFGNGTTVSAINEKGSRAVPVFDVMNSNMAYMMAFYRYDTHVMRGLKDMAETYIKGKKKEYGTIGKGCTVHDAGTIHNVNIGRGAVIKGALELINGTIAGSIERPVRIGSGVTARNFIMQSGAAADTGAVIENCLIGQSVSVGKQFSAEHCLVFANSELFHGEGCALFAGPYTVSHHKSSLMIAGYVLFFNAGSNTNQSNHMYKSGPVHQGVMERGSKTGSGSYMMWPALTGAFTTVTGRHKQHIHTQEFPFSIITREGDESVLYPGFNLTTAGTRRDILKWRKRDARHHSECLDYIHFDQLSPYVVQRAEKGLAILKEAAEKQTVKTNNVRIGGCVVRRLLIKAGIKNYTHLIDWFLFTILLTLDSIAGENKTPLRQAIRDMEQKADTTDRWHDIGGLYASGTSMEGLKRNIRQGRAAAVPDLMKQFKNIYSRYDDDRITWGLGLAYRVFGLWISEMEKQDALAMMKRLKTSVLSVDTSVLRDAKTEYGEVYKTGYGRDGNEQDRELDFQNVRGLYEDQDVIKCIVSHIEETEKQYKSLCDEIKKRWEQVNGAVKG